MSTEHIRAIDLARELGITTMRRTMDRHGIRYERSGRHQNAPLLITPAEADRLRAALERHRTLHPRRRGNRRVDVATEGLTRGELTDVAVSHFAQGLALLLSDLVRAITTIR